MFNKNAGFETWQNTNNYVGGTILRNIKRMKRQPDTRRKCLPNHISDKKHISRTHKELSNFQQIRQFLKMGTQQIHLNYNGKKKKKAVSSAGKQVQQLEFWCWKCKMVWPLWKLFCFLCRHLPLWHSMITSRFYIIKMQIYSHTNICTRDL